MSDLRLFIAIELPTSVRAELASLQSRLQHEPALKNVRWVSPNNIHLTLKFLGNVPQPRVPALTAAVRALIHRNADLTARVAALEGV